jgi:glucose/arabinose dehydrogenase
VKRAWLACCLIALSACTGTAVDTTTTTAPAPTTEPTTPAVTATAVDTTTTTTTAPPTTTTTTRPLPPPSLDQVSVDLQWVTGGFAAPVFSLSRASAQGAAGDDRMFVVDQTGTISAFVPPAPGEEPTRTSVVLDLSDRVDYGGERGLLGAAFHPLSPERLFVDYTRASDGATVIEEYSFPVGADAADPDPVATILVQDQPAANHNGGMLAFGPDGYLYASLGDGGGAGDTYENGQDPHTLLGTILRLDVDGGIPYAIPPDNPFADGLSGAPEVWLWGLRNPWRFSFDGTDLWIADVGQGEWEEIDVVGPSNGGADLGWPVFEGTHCYEGPCEDPSPFFSPVFEYGHDGGRCSVTGGYVYRGTAFPELAGAYVFGDYCTGEIGVLRLADGEAIDSRFYDPQVGGLTSFGLDRDGNLYATAWDSIYRVVVEG